MMKDISEPLSSLILGGMNRIDANKVISVCNITTKNCTTLCFPPNVASIVMAPNVKYVYCSQYNGVIYLLLLLTVKLIVISIYHTSE